MTYAYRSPQPPAQPRQLVPVIERDADTRATFLSRVYGHLLMAVLLFIAVEIAFFMSGFSDTVIDYISQRSGIVLALFFVGIMAGSFIATKASYSPNVGTQYLGLIGEVLIYAVLFIPLLDYAFRNDPGAIPSAAVVTAIAFAGLTLIAFFTRHDFSWLRGVLLFGFVVGFAAIVGALLFGWVLGLWFSVAMVFVAGAGILYQTQQIVQRYPAEYYVGAAVSLFGWVMMLFYYVLRIFARN
ncbi:MAG: hypothetical protein JJLCMIEE_00860 [Acidimicrobiales bacterium]|nr:MAG: permease [Actinomycetota bacterium]MBV6507802.1 hypothetical protein [Acidimicrobiales bacterium]RIK05960.1 MAG: permease [Acidobacteriota bacterium]